MGHRYNRRNFTDKENASIEIVKKLEDEESVEKALETCPTDPLNIGELLHEVHKVQNQEPIELLKEKENLKKREVMEILTTEKPNLDEHIKNIVTKALLTNGKEVTSEVVLDTVHVVKIVDGYYRNKHGNSLRNQLEKANDDNEKMRNEMEKMREEFNAKLQAEVAALKASKGKCRLCEKEIIEERFSPCEHIAGLVRKR